METPNTRSRKRRLEASQETSVTWRQDDAILRDLLASPSDKPLPLPSPTQRQRPIGSTSSLTSSACNKRPRRLRASGSSSSLTPASTTCAERNRLDELLDRFLDMNRPSSSTSTPSRSSSSTGVGNCKGVLSERSSNTPPVSRVRSLPVTAETAKTRPLDRQAKSLPRLPLSVAPMRRSSPRRAPATHSVAAPSPLRAEAPSPAARRTDSSSSAGGARSHLPTRMGMREHADRHDSAGRMEQPHTRSAPLPPLQAQPSSDGDTSIDSLDMMFEGGGEEIEMLLRAVDSGEGKGGGR